MSPIALLVPLLPEPLFRLGKAPLKLHRPVPRPHAQAESTPYRPAAGYFFGVSLSIRAAFDGLKIKYKSGCGAEFLFR